MANTSAKKSSAPRNGAKASPHKTSGNSAASSRSTGSRKAASAGTGRKRNGRGKSSAARGTQSSLTRDIVLLFLIALAILLFLSLFGITGVVGRVLAAFEFGLFGSLAYLFPFLFLLLVAFCISNFEKYPLNTTLRVLAALFTFSLLCGIIELIGSGGEILPKLKNYYDMGKGSRIHGGWFGGLWCRICLKALGRVGSYVIMVVLFLAGLVLTFGRALLTAAGLTGKRVSHAIRDESARYREASREKRQIAEMRAEERLQRRTLEREEKARKQGAERKALMDQLDLKLAEGRKNFPQDETLQLRELRKKEQSKPRQSGMFDETDLITPALPEDTSLQRLFAEMEGHRKRASVKKENRTLDELTEAFDEFDRSQQSAKKAEPRIRISGAGHSQKEEGKSAPEEDRAEAEKKTQKPLLAEDSVQKADTPSIPAEDPLPASLIGQEEWEPKWEDPREQLEKMHLEELFGPKGQAAEKPAPLPPEKNSPPADVFTSPAVPQGSEEGEVLLHAVKKEYKLPSTQLLKRAKNTGITKESDLKNTARLLEDTLRNFGVEVTVTDISCGPSVTRYELRPEQGVKVARISSLADDIKLALAATEIRIEAPIPGKSAVGIEVPNPENQTVSLRSIIESEEFNRINSKIAFAVGQDIGGRVVVADLAKMPHLLIAGATGSGKSVCINSLIMSILYRAKPDEVQMIMIDPKVVELGEYNGIPHLRIPVVTDPKLAAEALNGAVKEMTARYKKFADLNVKDIKGYNAKIRDNPEEYVDQEPLPQIVVIVDEFADLMMVAPGDVEQSVCRLAQLARAAGIHLVVATQRPSVNVITGLIKANIQSRIALAVSSGIDSRTIIDMNGAEKLLGKGDMLFYPTGYPKPVRVQGCWVSEEETEAVTKFWKKQNAVSEEQLVQQNKDWMPEPLDKTRDFKDERDELFMEAAEYIIENEKASIGNLQRVFRIGFNRAARLMDQLAEAGIVGKDDGTKARQIQMDRAQFEEWKRQ